MAKMHPAIGCCGIDCGLCPRFYTEGSSKCPGCGGEGFESKHPSCSTKSCCAHKHGLEICSQCAEFPCPKYGDRAKVERDSFVTHKRIFKNHETVRTAGFDAFIKSHNNRIELLKKMLESFDDGKSRSFFCLAATLLTENSLSAAMAEIADYAGDPKNKNAALKAILKRYAELEGTELKLIK